MGLGLPEVKLQIVLLSIITCLSLPLLILVLSGVNDTRVSSLDDVVGPWQQAVTREWVTLILKEDARCRPVRLVVHTWPGVARLSRPDSAIRLSGRHARCDIIVHVTGVRVTGVIPCTLPSGIPLFLSCLSFLPLSTCPTEYHLFSFVCVCVRALGWRPVAQRLAPVTNTAMIGYHGFKSRFGQAVYRAGMILSLLLTMYKKSYFHPLDTPPVCVCVYLPFRNFHAQCMRVLVCLCLFNYKTTKPASLTHTTTMLLQY